MIKIIKTLGLITIAILFVILISLVIWFEYYRIPPVSFTAIEQTRTTLIDGIKSYQNTKEYLNKIQKKGLPWKIVLDYKLEPGSRGAPYHQYIVSIPNFTHMDIRGELVVGFFNDRLMRTSFYPEEYEKYIGRLQEKTGLRLHIGFTGKYGYTLDGYTELLLATDHKKRRYIEWVDIRLLDEYFLWGKRYS